MMPEPKILSNLEPGVRVLIWTDNAPLSEETKGFASMNYLLDGLLRRHLLQPGPWNQLNFVHTLYGENFWMLFVNTSVESPTHFIQSLKALIPEASRAKAALFGAETPKAWSEALDKTFGSIEHLSQN